MPSWVQHYGRRLFSEESTSGNTFQIQSGGKYVEELPDELKFMLGLVSADILVVEIDNP